VSAFETALGSVIGVNLIVSSGLLLAVRFLTAISCQSDCVGRLATIHCEGRLLDLSIPRRRGITPERQVASR